MRALLSHLFEEWLFYLSLFLAVVFSVVAKRLPQISADEWRVLFILWLFLVLVKGLKVSGILDSVAARFSGGRFLGLKLVFLAGFLSLFITNDVALFVVVPLTLAVGGERVLDLVILETVAVNGLSAVSPIGNPQNIFIFHRFNLSVGEFVGAILPFGLAVLLVLLFLTPKELPSQTVKREVRLKRPLIHLFLFFLFIPVALKLLPLWVGFLPLLYALFFERELMKVDYYLLGTFLFFFAFTDNLSKLLTLHLSGSLSVFLSSALLSQVMSNVPAALLVSEFTDRWRELLWGVSVGGFGTIVASMANLITYRLYKEWGGKGTLFLKRFHLYSFLFFALGVLTFFVVELFQ